MRVATDVNLNDPNGDPAWDANVLSRDSGDGLLRSTVDYMKRVIFHYQATKYGKMVDVDMCMKMKCDLLKVKQNVDYALERIDALEALAVQVGLHLLPRVAFLAQLPLARVNAPLGLRLGHAGRPPRPQRGGVWCVMHA